MNLTEAQLYNLYSHGNSGANAEYIQNLINKSMAVHMYYDHKMGVREIANRLGVKMKEVSAWVRKH
jgi:DNA-binding transcriptional regulator LsrR (DeoR family)